MSAYCLFDVPEKTDPARIGKYCDGVFATVEKYGGRHLVLGGKFIEGR